MAKKIKSTDIFQGDIFAQQQKSAKEFIKVLNNLETELKDILKINKRIIDQSANETKSTEALKKRAQAINQVKNASSGLEQLEKERVRLVQKLNQSAEKQAKNNARLKVQIQQRNKQLKQQVREEMKLDGAYSKQSKSLANLRKRYKDLAIQGKANSREGKRLLNTITKLDTKIKQIDKSVGQSQRNVGNYGSAFSKLGGQLRNVAGAFGLVGGAMGIVRGITSAFTVVKDFDQAIATLGAVSGSTDYELEKLSNQALELGESTRFTATEVAGLQLELAKLGFTTQEIQDSTEGILNLSMATGQDLASSAKIAGSTLRAFNMDATEMNRVTSVLGVATTKSALNMDFLQTAMSKVAPVANAMGFSIEDTTALLGTLSNAGFDASMAGTATRNILLNLADSSGDLAQQLGRPVKNLDDLALGLKELQLKGVDLAESLELTDKRSVAAFQTFLNGTETMIGLKTSITDVEEELAEMSEKQLDTINGQLALLNSKWQGLILGTSESTGVVDKFKNGIAFLTRNLETILTTIFNVVKALIIFKTTQFAVNTVMRIGRGLALAYRISMVALNRGVLSATRSMKLFNLAVKSNPIGLIISGLTTAIALLWDFGDATDNLAEKQDKLRDSAEKASEALNESLTEREEKTKKVLKDIDLEIAKLKDLGASQDEINQKQLEKQKETISGLEEERDLRQQNWFEADAKADDYYSNWRDNQIEVQELEEKLRKIRSGEIEVQGTSGRNRMEMKDFLIRQNKTLIEQAKQRSYQAKQLENEQRKIADALQPELQANLTKLELARKELEIQKVQKEFDDAQIGTVAYWKQQIKDANDLLENNVKTRAKARIIQKQIAKFQREIDKILGKQNSKGKKGLDIAKARIKFEKELNKLMRERDAILDKIIIEKNQQQVKNVENQIEDEIELRREEARSQEFVAEGKRVDLEEFNSLIDEKARLQTKAVKLESDVERQNSLNRLNDLRVKLDKEVTDKKLSKKQADQLLLEAENKYQDELNLIALKERGRFQEIQDERVDAKEDADKEILDLQQATIDQISKDDLKVAENERQILQSRLQAFRDFTNQIIQLIDKQTDAKIRAIDKELTASEKREDELRQLAIKGTTTASQSLAEEQKRQAELERQKEELEKKKLRRQAVLSGLDLLSNKLANDEPDAVASTIRDITALIGILSTLPAFKEGAEFVSDPNAPKGRDKIIARIDEGERILTRDQNKKIGNLSNEELSNLASSYNNGVFDDVNYIKPKLKELSSPFQTNAQILNKFDELKHAIESKPMLTEVRWDEVSKMIVEKVETKNKVENRHSSTKGIF